MKRILAVLMLSIVCISCIYAAPKDRDSGIIWAATPIMGVDIADKHTSNYVWRNMSVNSDYETVVYTSTNSVVRQGGYWIVDSTAIVQEIKKLNQFVNVSGSSITIASVNTNVHVVIASGTIDQVSSGTVSVIGNVDTSISTGVISIAGNVAISSAGVFPLGDFNFNLKNSSIAVHNLGNSDVTVANIVQTYSSFSSSNTPSNEVGTVLTGSGVLHGIVVNTIGVGSTITVYDNTTNSGKKLCTVATTSLVPLLLYDAAVTNGITYESTGATPADITILWR
jgi:hypothetical protein